MKIDTRGGPAPQICAGSFGGMSVNPPYHLDHLDHLANCSSGGLLKGWACAAMPGRFMRLIRASVLVSTGIFPLIGSVAADTVLNREFPYQASQVAVGQVIADLGRASDLVVRVGEGVDGTVTLRNASGTVGDVLNETAAQIGAVWWYDGAIVHLEPASETTSAFVNPRGLTRAFIDREMDALGLSDPRFALWATGDEGVIRVSGPRGYVEQVVALIGTLIEVRHSRTGGGDEAGFYIPRIYHGRLAAG